MGRIVIGREVSCDQCHMTPPGQSQFAPMWPYTLLPQSGLDGGGVPQPGLDGGRGTPVRSGGYPSQVLVGVE